jgi:hypothetical protein
VGCRGGLIVGLGAGWSKWSLGDSLQALGKVTSGFGALKNEE